VFGNNLKRVVVGCVMTAGLAQPACGSSEPRRHPERDTDLDAGTGGRASGGTSSGGKSSGGTSTGGASAGGRATGGEVSGGSGGSEITDASSGGAPDVSVPDDSGTQTDASADAVADAAFVPRVDAGTGCELIDASPPPTPESASLPPAGLVTWLRADRGVYKTSANDVCAWVDQSGSGHVFRPSSNAERPAWLQDGIAAQPGIEFGGSRELRVESVLVLPAQSARTLIVVQRHVQTGGRFVPIETGNLSNNFTYLGIDANTFNTVGNREGVYMHGNAYDSDLATSTATRVHVYVIGTMTIGTPILPNVTYRVNSVPRTLTRTPGGTGNGNFESFASAHTTIIGDSRGEADSVVTEILVYDHALATEDVTAVESALKTRYGVSSGS